VMIHLQTIVIRLDEQDDRSIVADGHGVEVETHVGSEACFRINRMMTSLFQDLRFDTESPTRRSLRVR
jgi:hypothetical protein